MKAVIMCGGVGSRMRPITEVIPKPLLNIGGRAIVDILIEKLIEARADEIYLTLGYKAEQIIEFVSEKSYSVPVYFIVEEEPLGTAGSVKNAIGATFEDVLVISGDNIFSYDLQKAYEEHCNSQASVSIICDRREDPREYGTVCVNEDNFVVRFVEKPSWALTETDVINTGIYFLSGTVLNMIPSGKMYDFAHDLFPRLLQKHSDMKCILCEGEWGDLGDASAFFESNINALDGKYGAICNRASFVAENRMMTNGTLIYAPCVIEGNVLIDENCTIGPYAIISNDCHIRSGSEIRNAIVEKNCKIGINATLNGCYVGPSCEIGSYVRIQEQAILAGYSRILNYAVVEPSAKLSAGFIVNNSESVITTISENTVKTVSLTAAGTEGKAYETFYPCQAMLIGMAVASQDCIKRIGVADDASVLSGIFKSAVVAGLQSCGKTVYDFGSIFRSQRALFSQYCDLDFFICVTADESNVKLSFSARDCIPVTRKTERNIEACYRFNHFTYADVSNLQQVFLMEPLAAVYKSILSHMIPESNQKFPIAIECDNRMIYELMISVLKNNKYANSYGGLLFIIDKYGEKFYAVENEHAYSYDRILTICAYDAFKKQRDVLIHEEASGLIDDLAEKKNCKVYRLYEGQKEFDEAVYDLAEGNLWSFDGIFCIARLLEIMKKYNKTLSELSDEIPEQYVRHLCFDYTVQPMRFRQNLLHDGALRSKKRSGYFEWEDERGVIRVRPDSDGRRVRVLIETDSMEISRELAADAEMKIRNCSIDNL